MNTIIWCLIICVNVDFLRADCMLRLNKDFGSPSPVYLRHNKYMLPNGPSGIVLVNTSERVVIACPGKGKHVTAGELKEQEVVDATCVGNAIFRINNNKAGTNFSDFKCDSLPWFQAEELSTQKNCHPGNNQYKAYRVGYNIRDTFHKLYDLCFNQGLLHTVHAQHLVMPESAVIQTGGRRPAFIEGTLFGNVKVANAYKTSNQKSRFNSLLGEGSAEMYITNKHFLTRGHLAPRADFPLQAMQRASFHYANAAPQWMKGNAGDWAALEDAIRRRAIHLKRPLTVYTGSYGVSELPHSNNGRPVELYLDVDENNNDVIPIPLYFFKVVYDPPTKRASAFVSINSPFYNDTTLDQLTFCEDFCVGDNKPSWLRWRANDYTRSFCCSYDEFVVYDPPTKRASAFVSINSPFYNDTTLDQLTFCEDFCVGDNKPSWLRWRANDYTRSFCCSYDEFVRAIDVLPKLNVKGLFVYYVVLLRFFS